MRIIYDFGANNGDDILYYLLKADRVIAVDANPALAQGVVARFATEIAAGRLIVENVVLDLDGGGASVPFYIHRYSHVLSQFPRPAAEDLAGFDLVRLPAASPHELVERHGAPGYIKIDVEHYDDQIMRACSPMACVRL